MARLIAILMLGLGLVAGCAGGDSYVLIGGAEAASTAGTLEVEREAERTLLTIHLEFLPSPEQRQADLSTYVVWFITPQGKAIRGGKLVYEAAKREGHAELEGPAAPYELLVTAESQESPQQPSEFRVIAEPIVESR